MTDSENKERSYSIPGLQWIFMAVAVTMAAAIVRFYDLTLRPLHHDEGVNGFFLTNLFRDGVYKYDPANYHGPTLYYISLAFAKVFGLTTIGVRTSVAVFGVLTVILVLSLRRYLGNIGSLAAATFIALSPGMTFISRYFIHEIFFVFCSLGVVVAVVLYFDNQKAGLGSVLWMTLLLFVCFLPSALDLVNAIGIESQILNWSLIALAFIVESVLIGLVIKMLLDWQQGRPIYLILASACVALLFATKETAFITLGTMGIACACVAIWKKITGEGRLDKFRTSLLLLINVVGAIGLLYVVFYVLGGMDWLDQNFLGDARIEDKASAYLIITMAVVGLAAWLIYMVTSLDSKTDIEPAIDGIYEPRVSFDLGTGIDRTLLITAVAFTFIYLIVIFFSSYFTYSEGVQKAIEAYTIWTKTGTKDHTQNGMFAYVKWGLKIESPLFIISSIGAMIAMLKARHTFAMFTSLWAWGLFAAYTIIPYKTPWLALSFLLPMTLTSGYALNEFLTSRRILVKVAGFAVSVIAVVLMAYQSYQINFVRYDDEDMVYIYAHSKRGMLDLVNKMEYYAARSKGTDTTIEIVSPDYWPLTWYFNDYKHANFQGRLIDANTAEMIVAKKDEQDVDIVRRYSAHYRLVGVYPLRPGVDLTLLVRKDLAGPETEDIYKISEH